MSEFKTEEELAAKIVSWLHNEHWDVYQEVELSRGSGIIDIVARQGPIVWAIETKLTMSLALLEQGMERRGYAHYVSVATPRGIRARAGVRAVRVILQDTGIGWLTVGYGVDEIVAARLKRRPVLLPHMHLTEQHKTFAKAGNANGDRWTPFQETCRHLAKIVREKPGITMKEVMASLTHHYASNQSARSCLLQWIRKGVVKGVEGRREGKWIRMYPVA